MTGEQQLAQWYGVTWYASDVTEDSSDDRIAVDGEEEAEEPPS